MCIYKHMYLCVYVLYGIHSITHNVFATHPARALVRMSYAMCCRFPYFLSSNFQFESLKSEQIKCGCFFGTMSDFNVPGSRPKKTL